ncbi:MAG: hypothetical protein ACREBH_04130 [Candidatus Micrarchaeaceae archaeon]
MREASSNKERKKRKEISAYYVELESMLDLARHAFDYPTTHINAVRIGNAYRMFSQGEKIGDVRMLYYVTVDKLSNFLVYTPGSDSNERFEMRESVHEADYRSYKAPIVEMLSNPYTEVKDIKKDGKVVKVGVRDPNMLIRSVAGYGHDDEMLPKLYSFYSGKDHIIGTFDFFREGGAKIFTYAKTEMEQRFSAIRYNYTSDSIEPVNSFAEKSALYIRIINLKSPFPFF